MHSFKLCTFLDEIAVVSRVYFNFVIFIGVYRHDSGLPRLFYEPPG